MIEAIRSLQCLMVFLLLLFLFSLCVRARVSAVMYVQMRLPTLLSLGAEPPAGRGERKPTTLRRITRPTIHPYRHVCPVRPQASREDALSAGDQAATQLGRLPVRKQTQHKHNTNQNGRNTLQHCNEPTGKVYRSLTHPSIYLSVLRCLPLLSPFRVLQ